MPDYSKGQIYRIVDIGFNQCYIGSTVEGLSQRMARHRTKYKSWKEGKIRMTTAYLLFDMYGIDNCKIVLIENYPCNSRKELEARETYYQERMECINQRFANRSPEQYYQDNQERLKEYKKVYCQNNPEKVKEQGKKYYQKKKELSLPTECICGSTYRYNGKIRHEKSKKHQKYLQTQPDIQ